MIGKRVKKGSGVVISDVQCDRTVTVVAGVDAGSTETRVCLADYNDMGMFGDNSRVSEALENLLVTYKIPSTYAIVEDAREIPPVSDSLEDNYDSGVILINNGAEKPLLSKHRVLRGRKIQDATGLVSRYLDSSTNKTDNIIFYMNIIDALGYAIMQKYNGCIPKTVDVNMVLSVRPKELTAICKKKMVDNLVGSFMFIWGPRAVGLTINIKTLDFTTEPEAEITGTTTVCDLRSAAGIEPAKNTELADRLSNSECFVHIEGGGSSIGVEVLREGQIIDACSSTFQLGGNYLAQVFIDRIRDTQGRTITKEAANKAIITCLLRDGRGCIDVGEAVAQCKNRVGLDILERLRHEVIDLMSDLTLNDVEFISLGGRLFLPDECGNTIGEYFSEYVHQISPNTEVLILPENLIAQGNLVIGLNSDAANNLTPVNFPVPEAGTQVAPATHVDEE